MGGGLEPPPPAPWLRYCSEVNRLGYVLELATHNCLHSDSLIHWNGSGWLYGSALQFLPPAPEVLAEIKTTIFCNAFCFLILRLELSHNAI